MDGGLTWTVGWCGRWAGVDGELGGGRRGTAPAPAVAPVPVRRGARPLPQALALAPLLRRVTGLVLALETEQPPVAALLRQLTEAEAALRELVPADLAPRLAAGGGDRVYLDHSHDIGAFNPCFPEYEISVAGEVALGSVEFPLAFEGPPGSVHGGALSLFFDTVIQQHNCELGIAGKTVSLQVDYHRPVPLLRPLAFEIRRTQAGDRSTSHARLHGPSRDVSASRDVSTFGSGNTSGSDGTPGSSSTPGSDGTSVSNSVDRVYCTATVTAVAGDVSRLPKLSPRRTEPCS